MAPYLAHLSNPISYFKSPIYSVGQPIVEGKPLPNLFSLRDPEHHMKLRRTIGSLYSMSAIGDLEFRIDNCVNTLISKFRQMTQDKPAVIDMSAWMQFFAFDTIGAVNFSRNFGFLDSGTDVDWAIKEAEERMRYFEVVSFLDQNLANLRGR